MLRALYQESGLGINADDVDIKNKGEYSNIFLCPLTQKEVVFVRPHQRKIAEDITTVRAFFRHKDKNVEIPFQFLEDRDYFINRQGRLYINESLEHQVGKQQVKTFCKSWYDDDVDIQYEYIIKLPSGRWRIADIAVIFPNGGMDVHEIQLSAITPETLEARSSDYYSQGINSYWYFGKAADTDANRKWYFDNTGEMPNILYYGEYNATL